MKVGLAELGLPFHFSYIPLALEQQSFLLEKAYVCTSDSFSCVRGHAR